MSAIRKVVYYGSCQARAIAKLLDHVLPGDVILNYPYIQKQEPLPPHLYSADIVIYQLYHPTIEKHMPYHTDLLVEKVKATNPGAKLVCIPFICFYGYWPDYTIDSRNNATISSALPYGAFPQQSRVLSDCTSVTEACMAVLKSVYTRDEVITRIDTMLLKTKASDALCDVKLHDYIASNYRIPSKPPLFYSVQHPRNNVLEHVAKQILEVLGLPLSKENTTRMATIPELLDDHHALILPCVRQALELSVTQFKLYDKTWVDSIGYAMAYATTVTATR